MKKSWLVIVIIMLCSFTPVRRNFEPDFLSKTVLLSETEFKNGVYLYEKRAFSGNIVAYYENERLKFKCEVFEGKLHGLTSEYFANGEIKSNRNYYLGKLYGNFEEFFDNGQLRLTGKVRSTNYHGGEEMEEITIYTRKGNRLKSKKTGKAKIIFIDDKGKHFRSSEEIPIYLQQHYIIASMDGSKVLAEVD